MTKPYFPDEVKLEEMDGELCLVDSFLCGYEAGILCRFGHKNTDLPDSMLKDFAEGLVVLINEKGREK